jgi:putative lipoprotein
LWGRDKALHFGASGGLALVGYGASVLTGQREPVRLAVGAGLALGAGLVKETLDLWTAGDASRRDLAWNVLGTASGLLLAWLAHRAIHRVAAVAAR